MNSLHRHIIVLYILLLAAVVIFARHAQVLEIVKTKQELNDGYDKDYNQTQCVEMLNMKNKIEALDKIGQADMQGLAHGDAVDLDFKERLTTQKERHMILVKRVEALEKFHQGRESCK